MRKILFLLLITVCSYGQVPQNFPYSIRNTGATTDTTPAFIISSQTDNIYKKTSPLDLPISTKVQDSLTALRSDIPDVSNFAHLDENDKLIISEYNSSGGNIGQFRTPNLASTTTYTAGFFVNFITGNLTANDIYSATDYISVNPGQKYRWFQKTNLTNVLYGAYYDKNNIFISGINVAANDVLITVPAGAYKVRLTYANVPNEGNFYFYKTLKFSSYGDSITAQNKWQPLLSNYLSLTTTVVGFGGATLSGTGANPLNQDTRLNTIPLDSDVITVMAGTNDWAQSIALGSPTSSNVNEFYGALNSTFKKLKIRYPNAVIIALATPYGEFPDRVDFTNKIGIINNLGLSTTDYGNAFIEAAKNNNIRFVNTHNVWGNLNISKFVTFDGAYLHPNDLGGKELASKISLDIIQDILNIHSNNRTSGTADKIAKYNPSGTGLTNTIITDNGVSVSVSGTISFSPAVLSTEGVVKSQLDLKADLASPTFTGTPTAPTAAAGTNTTQIATTAFVNNAVNGDSYTPTLTAINNVSSSSLINASYIRVGNIVTVQVGLSLTPTLITTSTVINIDLPFSRATSGNKILGIASTYSGKSTNLQSISTSAVTLNYQSDSISATAISLSFQYSVLD